jgi:23S rRNA U2552 (ribose-2'-O)-methylase RlmE/FtsJ
MGEFYPPALGATRRESNPLEQYFDSHHEGPGIWKSRHYFDIYHHHFAKFVGREINILEIGIYSGGSLGMWKQYFGPKCRVFGVDIAEDCKSYEDEQTTVLIGDQSDRKFWARVRSEVPPLDVVIDDGSHVAEHQIITLEEILPHVRLGGVFLCEDIAPAGNPMVDYVAGLTHNLFETNKTNPDGTISETSTYTSWFQSRIHSVHFYPYVIVIEKNGSPVDVFSLEKHGTQWKPWVFRQGQFIETAGNAKG